mmetsp:Transcript_25027/g.58719  ORF Transcript_25027/g.58719 Transcript_25027/m.58719 type:complete len:92 (+) Transcript_25027:75-350(+)
MLRRMPPRWSKMAMSEAKSGSSKVPKERGLSITIIYLGDLGLRITAIVVIVSASAMTLTTGYQMAPPVVEDQSYRRLYGDEAIQRRRGNHR